MRFEVMAEQSQGPQARRSVRVAAGLAFAASALGACELVPSPQVQTTVPPVEPQQPEPQPQTQPDVPQVTLPSDEARNRVAVLVPLSGANAGVGQSLANAANLALQDTGGERIRITIYDTAKGGAAAAANEALAQGNRLILGPLLSEDVRAVAPIARRADVPVISFSNDVSVAGNGVYLMGFTPSQAVGRVVSYVRSQGVDRFGALTPSGVYGSRAGQAMLDSVQRSGGRMVGMQTFDRGAAGIRAAVTRLNVQGTYDAVLIADSGRNATLIAPVVKSGPGAGARLLGTELWATEADLGRTASLRGAWYASVSDTLFNQFQDRYRARFGANPYRLASLGYDSVLLAVRVAGDWQAGRPFPVRALRDSAGFEGLDGAFRFGTNGIAERALEVREVTAGGYRVVSPAPEGFD